MGIVRSLWFCGQRNLRYVRAHVSAEKEHSFTRRLYKDRQPPDHILPTVDSATSIPSINNSPWIRGAPHSGFSRLIRRISARISESILGRPPTWRDFQPVGAETASVPADHGLRLDDDDGVQERRVQSIQLYQQQAIDVPQSHALPGLAP